MRNKLSTNQQTPNTIHNDKQDKHMKYNKNNNITQHEEILRNIRYLTPQSRYRKIIRSTNKRGMRHMKTKNQQTD